jgi:hypothetical protein
VESPEYQGNRSVPCWDYLTESSEIPAVYRSGAHILPAIKTLRRGSMLPGISRVRTAFASHCFHSTTEPGLHQQTAQPDSSVPFQQRHAHETYTVPQSVMRLHLAGPKASATHRWTRAAPGYRPRSRPLQAAYCTRRHERRFAKRKRPRIASQRPGGYVRPEAHSQAGQ